jgi:hypothetical protein
MHMMGRDSVYKESRRVGREAHDVIHDALDECEFKRILGSAHSDPEIIGLMSRCEGQRREYLASGFSSLLKMLVVSSHKKVRCRALQGKLWRKFHCNEELDISASEMLKHFLEHERKSEIYPKLKLTWARPQWQDYTYLFQDPKAKRELERLEQRSRIHGSIIESLKQLKGEVEHLEQECHGQYQIIESLSQIERELERLEQRYHNEQQITEAITQIEKELKRLEQIWHNRRSELEAKLRSAKARRLKVTVQRIFETSGARTCTEPQEKQWRSLRSLRSASNDLHRHILSITGRESRCLHGFKQSTSIRRLGQQCKSSSNFLNTGILTFRDVLRGQVPSTLKEVLAFVCLSYIMSEVLRSKGEIKPPVDFFRGFPKWRQAIQDQSEREAFDEVVSLIWPEARMMLQVGPGHNEPFQIRESTEYPFLTPEDLQVSLAAQSSQCPGPEIQAVSVGPLADSNGDIFGRPSLGIRALSEEAAGLTTDGQIRGVIGPQHILDKTSGDFQASEDYLQFFQQPVEDLLWQTESSDDIRWSDFLNLPDLGSPVAKAPALFMDSESALDTTAGVINASSNVITPGLVTDAYDVVGTMVAPSSIPVAPEGLLLSPEQPMPGASSLLVGLWATTIFQIALLFLNCKEESTHSSIFLLSH